MKPTASALRALLPLALFAPPPGGQSLPPEFESVPLTGSFQLPTACTFAPDGTLFVVEKTGTVRVHDGVALQPQPFLDLTDEVNNDHDRGLLAIALHPGFAPDGGASSWVYLLYTVSPVPGQDLAYDENDQYSFSRLARYRAVTAGGALVADPSSRHVLLGNALPDGSVPDAIASLHNSHSNGSLFFADDGSLLFGTGDGAHYNYQDNGGNDDPGFDDFTHPGTGLKGPTPAAQDAGAYRAQDLGSLAGKILRIDPETGLGYPSNPFYDGDPASNASRVWALGLRNPFNATPIPGTGAADPALGAPNAILLGDVGWGIWEEIDLCLGGENFGWPCYEGPFPQPGYQNFDSPDPGFPDCSAGTPGQLTGPLLTWSHFFVWDVQPPGVYVDESGAPLPGFLGACAIGGAVYPGGSYPPEYAGRLFFADYEAGFIKTMELDAGLGIVAVRDFASGLEDIVDIEAHPLTGDLHYVLVQEGRVYRLRHAPNQTPVAELAATPTFGPAPLAVAFDGSGSYDPEGSALVFDWDFGDGAPGSSAVAPQHVYASEGVYAAQLTVTDPGGLSASQTVDVFVGNSPPEVTILSPLPGQTLVPPTTLPLVGQALDPDGDPVTYTWQVDLYHDDHVHPGSLISSQQQALLSVDDHGPAGALVYHRVELRASDPAGLTGSAHVFVYAEHDLTDVAGTALPISRMDELVPPSPTGGGNPDFEVLRDGVLPPVGSQASSLQYDTFHAGAQGQDDWIGYELTAVPGSEQRLVQLLFQEGKHFLDGGWFDAFHVEVREAGVWKTAENLVVTPAYPFPLAGQPFFDGVSFQTYRLDFDPLHGDAVRLRGDPGGSAGFLSAGELRAFAVQKAGPPPAHADVTAGGAVVARLFELSPPVPLGTGNPDPETIRNGTYPAAGSASLHAQFDTFHGGDQGGLDWIGYAFPTLRTFSRVVFQEGLHFPNGGAFDTLAVEVQHAPGDAWTPVTGLTASPPYPGHDGPAGSYGTYTLDFDPTVGRAVRVAGDPAGSADFISVGELRVHEPALPGGCGWVPYGEGAGGANALVLASDTPPGLGLPVALEASGAPQAGAGSLAVSVGAASLPLFGGTLLVFPANVLLPLTFNSAGQAELQTLLPGTPSFHGSQVYFQAFFYGDDLPTSLLLSNGLEGLLCEGID